MYLTHNLESCMLYAGIIVMQWKSTEWMNIVYIIIKKCFEVLVFSWSSLYDFHFYQTWSTDYWLLWEYVLYKYLMIITINYLLFQTLTQMSWIQTQRMLKRKWLNFSSRKRSQLLIRKCVVVLLDLFLEISAIIT